MLEVDIESEPFQMIVYGDEFTFLKEQTWQCFEWLIEILKKIS